MAHFSKFGNLAGKKFGRLTVLKQHGVAKSGHILWDCECECGKSKIVSSSNLVNGNVKSCGCLQDEVRKTICKQNLSTNGWDETCKHCGKKFISRSHKQVYCSARCSFFGRIKKDEKTGCIEWQGNINNQGYGVLRSEENKRKMVSAHRFVWELFNGKIPDGMCICHKCDNRKCVNIEHLFLGTWYDNNHDRSIKGRSGKRKYTDDERKRYSIMNRGENNNYSKLTESQVLEIKKLKGRFTIQNIADMYSVSKSCIKDIFGGKTWTFLKDNT